MKLCQFSVCNRIAVRSSVVNGGRLPSKTSFLVEIMSAADLAPLPFSVSKSACEQVYILIDMTANGKIQYI